MHTDTTPRERPTGSANNAAGHTDSPIVADKPDTGKMFGTLRARFPMQGHSLHRTGPDGGPVAYYAERWGLVRYLPTLDDVDRFLMPIGGAQ